MSSQHPPPRPLHFNNVGPAPSVPTVEQLADIFEQLDALQATRAWDKTQFPIEDEKPA
jgi:hypothetical protein